MIFPAATFDSLEQIPEKYEGSPRDEFENVNGKWQLKQSAIPGVGELFNKAIADNATRAVNQVKAKNQRIQQLEMELDAAKTELQNLKIPGAVVLSPEDAKTWGKVTDLIKKHGSVKDIEKALDELPVLKEKTAREEKKATLTKLAADLGLSPDVLIDWANHPEEGKGLEFFTKEVQVADPKNPGKTVTAIQGFVKITTEENGRTKENEVPLVEAAKTRLAAWKQQALFTKPDTQGQNQGANSSLSQNAQQHQFQQTGQPVINGIVFPANSGSGQGVSGGGAAETKSLLAKFQAERDKVPNPFAPGPANTGQTQ